MLSCISEGMIPKGFQCHFSLAYDVNNKQFVESIQKACDIHSSTILDIVLSHKQNELHSLQRNINYHDRVLEEQLSESRKTRIKLLIKKVSAFSDCWSRLKCSWGHMGGLKIVNYAPRKGRIEPGLKNGPIHTSSEHK